MNRFWGSEKIARNVWVGDYTYLLTTAHTHPNAIPYPTPLPAAAFAAQLSAFCNCLRISTIGRKVEGLVEVGGCNRLTDRRDNPHPIQCIGSIAPNDGGTLLYVRG
jgi:hypothetical protein